MTKHKNDRNDELHTEQKASIVKKEVPVELVLHDGTHMQGTVNISTAVNPHNLFEKLPVFFHLNRGDNAYYLINKAYVVLCKIPEH